MQVKCIQLHHLISFLYIQSLIIPVQPQPNLYLDLTLLYVHLKIALIATFRYWMHSMKKKTKNTNLQHTINSKLCFNFECTMILWCGLHPGIIAGREEMVQIQH